MASALSLRSSVASTSSIARPRVSRSRASVRVMANQNAGGSTSGISQDEQYKRQQEILKARRENIPKNDRKESPGVGPKSMKRLLNNSPANMQPLGERENYATEAEKTKPLKVADEHEGSSIGEKVKEAASKVADALNPKKDA